MPGSDWPWQDTGRDHGASLEGYYWRITDARTGRVVVALCGACRGPRGHWALAALAVAPGDTVTSATVPSPVTRNDAFGVRAGEILDGTLERLSAAPTPDVRVDVSLSGDHQYHGRALGPAHLLPGLPQYWSPRVLGARVEGELVIGGRRIDLTGARAYVERNWGRAFPGRWWWGQADALGDEDVCVAFAGGSIAHGVHASAIVARIGPTVLRFPLARGRGFTLRARWGAHAITLEGEPAGRGPAVLPVPIPAEHRVEDRSHQWLTGRLRMVVRRGRRELFRGESGLAGLEHGHPEAVACG